MSKARTVVSTGRTGSIGKRLSHRIVGLQTRLDASISSMIDELRAQECLPDVFLHLAAMTSVRDCEADPGLAYARNVDGALKWMKACHQVGITQFIQVSTSHVFAPTLSPIFLNPDDDPNPTAVYGKTKLEAENALNAFASANGMNLSIARVFSVFGEDMRPGFLYPELVRRAKERDLKPLPGYQNVRDFIHVSSVAERLEALASMNRFGVAKYHICTGMPRSVRELATQVFLEFGYQNSEIEEMFSMPADPPNYLISKPTEFESEK